MFKSAVRAAPRRIVPTQSFLGSSRRFLSTAPPAKKSRTWKSSALRWGLAAGSVYYYNTSNVFAQEPEATIQRLDESIHHIQESNQPTIDAIVEEKRLREAQQLAEEQKKYITAEEAAGQETGGDSEDSELEGLEEEAGQQGAFNPETGEINWDCPCLGGMAHGPCGEEFKAAFSCFVYSNEEPKGVECIDKFKGMQDCFRQHPEMYGSELEDDEDEVEAELQSREGAPAPEEPSHKSEPTQEEQISSKPTPPIVEEKKLEEASQHDSRETTAVEAEKGGNEGGDLVPRAAHDGTK